LTVTQDLYTAKDVATVRQLLYDEQLGKCALSNKQFNLRDLHLDHVHNEQQFVRGVLYKQSNMLLGKLENLSVRYLNHWYPEGLPSFLRQAADYIERTEKQPDTRYRHPGWIKRVKVLFNKLNAEQQNKCLVELGYNRGSNPKQRKEYFAKATMDRSLGFERIVNVLDKTKGNQ